MDSCSEEKGSGDECFDDLEEKISEFFSGPSEGSDCLSVITDNDDDDDTHEKKDAELEQLERAEFWQTQQASLKEILSHTKTYGSKLRREVTKVTKEAREKTKCHCQTPISTCCATCLRQRVIDHLRTVGYDAALCLSTWKATKEMPSGKHEYIDVVIPSKDGKKETRFVVELEFRSEFEIIKACDEYVTLVNLLSELYVGKLNHLNALVRIVCDAGKRSMKEKKIHMGPWRKRKFMQLKWSSSYWRWPADRSRTSTIQSKQIHMPSFIYPTIRVA